MRRRQFSTNEKRWRTLRSVALEIERRFLVDVARLPDSVRADGVRLEQGYLGFEPTVRIRCSGERGWLTVKGPGSISRAEFEYEIPRDDADALLRLCKARLRKIRRKVPVGGGVWDVDEFLETLDGLWLAEIELATPESSFERPDWLGREVTDDRRYSNASLARHGRPDPM